ncbi:MAG: M20/M25/M40 family metallo-hydrolase [Solirubrobacteraceae bacterium]
MTVSVDAEAVRRGLQGEVEPMLEQIDRLASIDSGSDDAAGVGLVCAELGAILSAAGFSVSPRPEGGLAGTIVLGTGPRLLIVGHADTVWPAGTAAAWPPRRDQTMMSGPGVGDMKSCLVMAVHAVVAAQRAGADGVGEVELLVVGDEELGSPRSRPWIEERARGAAACLGLEAGWPGGGVVTARGAVGALQVKAHGRAAHCAGHEGPGASAVAALAPIVGRLEDLSRPEQELLVTVGVFRGGFARQVVPETAELSIDLRAPSPDSAERLVAQMRAVVDSADGGGGVQLHLSGGITRPAFPQAMSRELFGLMNVRALQLGVPLAAVASRGGSDASFAAALGVPTLDGLGPICHDSCARGERIEIASLADRGALMTLLILDLAARWRYQARASGKVDTPA